MNDPLLRHGTKHCKCTGCGEYFTTPRNFDLHRTTVRGQRVCTPPGRVVNRKGKALLHRNGVGIWAKAEGAYIPRKT